MGLDSRQVRHQALFSITALFSTIASVDLQSPSKIPQHSHVCLKRFHLKLQVFRTVESPYTLSVRGFVMD